MADILSKRANDDITDIWIKIALDSVDSADRVEAEILRNCEILAKFPGWVVPEQILPRDRCSFGQRCRLKIIGSFTAFAVRKSLFCE
jgi:plasmid stabilization system protein ParE